MVRRVIVYFGGSEKGGGDEDGDGRSLARLRSSYLSSIVMGDNTET